MTDFPPYQSVDIVLGIDKGVISKPVKGYVISEAGYYDRPQVFPDDKATFMTESPDEATEIYCYALEFNKYPDCVQVKKCWIHSESNIGAESNISKRKYWTLRL